MSGPMSIANLSQQELRASVPFHWTDKVAAVAVLVLVVYLARGENLVWVPLVFGALVSSALLLVRWPNVAVLELMVAGAIPRWFTKIGTWNAKPEHMVAAACCGVLFLRICTGNHKWARLEKLDVLLLAFLAANYLSSSLYSPQVSSTLRWALLQTLAVSPYFLIRQLVRTKEQLDKAMTWYLWVGVLEAVFGILCAIGHSFFGTSTGITLFFYLSFIPGVHGSLWEPNIFGSYCACFAVMCLYYFLAQQHKGWNLWYLAGVAVTTIGISLSLARQGWVCLIYVGGMILFFHLRRRGIRRKRLAVVVVGLLAALIAAIVSMNNEGSERLASLTPEQAAQDPTVLRRAGLVALAIDDITLHPVVGLGSSSFQLLYLGEDDSYQGVGDAWLGTFFFRILHDTGIIGSILLGWFMINLVIRCWRVQRRRSSRDVAVGALSAAGVVMLIAYQLTDASTLAFTWVHLGLLVTALRLAEATPADPVDTAKSPAY
jgi:hypothetical protein